MSKTVITFYTDGGARGNPGPAAAGVYSPELGNFKKYLGHATNNHAEYSAVVLAMEQAVHYQQKHPAVQEINFFLDSELVVKQLKREYRVKDKNLQTLFLKVWNLMAKFKQVTFTHIPREQNKKADKLVNEALDEQPTSPPTPLL
ncbi:MAG: ribonuclease HI family protein [Patescibacteria group bacterium]|jgi:ribonuclease HI